MTTFMSNGKIHKFEFEEETHTYRLDGYKIPSVSAILDMLYPKDFMNQDIIDGMEWGIYIHKTCNKQYHEVLGGIKDCINEKQKEWRRKAIPYIKHFREFSKKYLDKINCIWEKPDYHKDLKYGMTRDIQDKTNIIIWDIKTGKKPGKKLQERYQLQLMAYRPSVDYKINILYLSPDGYEIKEVKWDGKLWRMFLMALSVYNFSRR